MPRDDHPNRLAVPAQVRRVRQRGPVRSEKAAPPAAAQREREKRGSADTRGGRLCPHSGVAQEPYNVMLRERLDFR
jgi:hypothetical protein